MVSVSPDVDREGRFAVIAAWDRLDLHKAADTLEVPRHDLRLATEADMAADFSEYEVGAIPPIGPETPVELIDVRLLDYERVLCPAGDHELLEAIAADIAEEGARVFSRAAAAWDLLTADTSHDRPA